ncbi:MAG: lipoate--protein ligase family protein [Candidatus Omnitrophica bacterium]|nr:lipoate--protein ligase family protein [Candidatus Omnitrophota bacterium]
MRLKNISFSNPQENILFDDVLLELAEQKKAPETLRFWESEQLFIVLGKISKVQDDVFVDVAQNNCIPILRRSSGGGTVLQGKGCLNFSLILSKDSHPDLQTISRSYQFILGKITAALESLAILAQWRPISDVALKNTNQKISGNAQKRARRFILHHGTILYDFNLSLIEKYLKIPKIYPDYRQNRLHGEFVANIQKKSEDIKRVVAAQFPISLVENTLGSDEEYCLKKFCQKQSIYILK